MLESVVATLLNRVLGAYVENFDPKQLNIGIWNGDVSLKNLRLKRESLEKLDLPIDVKFGHLGELTLQIPWSNLKSKPVKVTIEEVYLFCSPILPTVYDPEAERQRELRIKKQKLENLELITKTRLEKESLSKGEEIKSEAFTDSLVTKIIDNLQVTIKNIHIRYEDDHAFTDSPYAVGFTMSELSAVSADESWIASFISGLSTYARKLLNLKSLSAYWDTENTSIYTDDHDELLQNLKDIVQRSSQNDKNIHYILKPVSGRGHLTVNKLGTTEEAPHYNAKLFFDEFSLDLDGRQYKDILWTMSQMNWYAKTHQFRKYRPDVSIDEDPKAWLRYAFKSVYNEIHERNYKWTWEYFEKRRDNRKLYLGLWKKKLGDIVLNPEEQKQLDSLEENISYEDIKFYRSLARVQFKKESKAIIKPDASNIQRNANGGWISSWWRGNSPSQAASTQQETDSPEDSMDLSDVEITDDQRKEFYDAIEYDERQTLYDAADLPRDTVKSVISCELKKGSFSIKPNRSQDNIAEVIFEGCLVDFFERKDSFYAGFKLNELRVDDGSEHALYKHICSVKPVSSIHSHESSPNDSDEDDKDPFFQISFEKNPLDGSADSELLAKMNGMTIYYNRTFLENVFNFFKPPKTHLDTIGMILNAAESTFEDFAAQTRIGLQYAFEEHKTINCKMDLQAPLIILPLDATNWNSPVAILDAGHISVVSDLADKSKMEEIRKTSKADYTDDDWDALTSYLYDRFNLILQDAQILIGSNIKSTIEQLHGGENRTAVILDQLTIKTLLEVSIIPTYYQIPKFKLSSDVPRFRAMISDYQYKVFMDLIQNLVPDFSFSDSQEETGSDVYDVFRSFNKELLNSPGEIEDSKIEGITTDTISTTSKSADAASKQKTLQVNFAIDVIELTLSRCTSANTLEKEKLVDLIGDKFRVDMSSTANGIEVAVVLSDMSLIDHIDTSSSDEFRNLVSSKFDSHSDLFSINYIRSKRMVQYKKDSIEVFDQDIQMNIADFKIIVTRKSILTLLNFCLTTFTDPNPPETPADLLRHNDQNGETAPQHLNVNMNLESITLILNDDGIKLASMELNRAFIKTNMLPEKMKVEAKIGGFSLYDEMIDNNSINSIMRNLVTMEGDELAELVYETFDSATNTENYGSLIDFRTGSMNIMFVESSFSKIMDYLNQFQRMKYIYDTARESALDQANTIEGANNMKFDISIKAPIFTFPKVVDPRIDLYDAVVVDLGEFHASNTFELKLGFDLNLMSVGLRNTTIKSRFFDGKDKVQDLKVLESLDIGVNIDYCSVYTPDRPTMTITGGITGKAMKLTELQAQFLFNISQSVGRVFGTTNDTSYEDIEEDAVRVNQVLSVRNRLKSISSMKQEDRNLAADSAPDNKPKIPADHIEIDVDFKIPLLSLTLYNRTKGNLTLEGAALSKFSLNELLIKLQLRNDGNFKSDLHLKSFVVEDVRSITENKFREIMPEVSPDNYQIMASISSEGDLIKKTYIDVAVDSPRLILALDHMFSLKEFVDFVFTAPPMIPQPTGSTGNALSINKHIIGDDSEPSVHNIDNAMEDQEDSSKFILNINIFNPSVILLADPRDTETEAVVFKISQVVLESQDITSFRLTDVGMFLCKMNNFDTQRLRLIDDFSVDLKVDVSETKENHLLNTIQMTVDPLLMRLSIRDIKLAIDIINRASEMYSNLSGNTGRSDLKRKDSNYETYPEDFRRKLSKYAPSIVSSLSKVTSLSNTLTRNPTIVTKGENMAIDTNGMRLVLIGDVHELPMLDMESKPFSISAKNWSTDLEVDTRITSSIKVLNYSTSSWEALLEPWTFTIHIGKVLEPKPSLGIDIESREVADVTITSRTISLLSNLTNVLTDSRELAARGEDAPYLIMNETGYDMNIWIDKGLDAKEQLTLLRDGASCPWQFEDWREVRESLSTEGESTFIGVELIDSPYDELYGISLKREQEKVLLLKPTVNGIHNRLICEVILGSDKIKRVKLRSSVCIQNYTQATIFVGAGRFKGAVDNITIDREIKLSPGSIIALPIDVVYSDTFVIRPDVRDQLFGWSVAKTNTGKFVDMDWKTVQENDLLLECPKIEEGSAANYFFNVHAAVDDGVMNKVYPHIQINVMPPLEIENLLPFDITWRLHQKGSKSDWSNILKKGENCAVHVVDMNLHLLLKIKPVDSKFLESKFGIVNVPAGSGFELDNRLLLESSEEDNQRLYLNLHYAKSAKAGVKIVIYSPYLILNKTGQDIMLSENGNIMYSKGRNSFDKDGNFNWAEPNMFSFGFETTGKGFIGGNLESNTVSLKVGDSIPSVPLSIDKIGQSLEMTVSLRSRVLENNVGIHISEGKGKYVFTKVVSISPRYVIRNDLEHSIQVKAIGSSKVWDIDPKMLRPLYQMPKTRNKKISMGFVGSNSTWSAPFGIQDIGDVYVRVQKPGQAGHTLIRVRIVIESATLFIDITDAMDMWPFSIRNFSNYELSIFQSNPFVDESGNITSKEEFHPICYRIPPRSVMPYAWDFPAGHVKELVLKVGANMRKVQLAEIGALMPMKFKDDDTIGIVDLNVIADNTIQALVISDYDPSTSLYKINNRTSSETTLSGKSQGGFKATEKEENYHAKILFKFEGVNISLINLKNQELCLTSIKGTELRYNESDLYQNVSLKMKWIQIDNQLFSCIYPILLYPSVVPKSTNEMSDHPAFSASVSRQKGNSHGVTYIKYATVLLQEMSVELDEDFLYALLEFSKIPGASWSKETYSPIWEQDLKIPEPPEIRTSVDTYFELLHLQPIQIDLSFVKTERITAEDAVEGASRSIFGYALNILTMTIGNINDAPIRLSSLFLENTRTPVSYLIQNIQEHYQQAALYQIYKILGSADVLGNPVGLFNNISSGVLDIFYEPYQGFIMTDRPQELGIGLAKGGISFLKKSVFGVSDSFAKFTNSVAKGLTVATMDKDFQQRRNMRERNRNRPKQPFNHLSTGTNSLMDGITSGIKGLALDPAVGAKSGASGFFKGVGKGLIGLPTKTAAGIFDFANNISEGIRSTTMVFEGDGLDRARLPRYINFDGSVSSYSERESQGQFWLKTADGGKYMDDTYLAHVMLPGQVFAVVVSLKRIVIINIANVVVDWQATYDQIADIKREETGITITERSLAATKKFIVIPLASDRAFLYKKIEFAVQEYTKKSQIIL